MGHEKAAMSKLFEVYQQKLGFYKKLKLQKLQCLFTDVTPSKGKLHSTPFSTESVRLGCQTGQNCNCSSENPNEVLLLNGGKKCP